MWNVNINFRKQWRYSKLIKIPNKSLKDINKVISNGKFNYDLNKSEIKPIITLELQNIQPVLKLEFLNQGNWIQNSMTEGAIRIHLFAVDSVQSGFSGVVEILMKGFMSSRCEEELKKLTDKPVVVDWRFSDFADRSQQALPSVLAFFAQNVFDDFICNLPWGVGLVIDARSAIEASLSRGHLAENCCDVRRQIVLELNIPNCVAVDELFRVHWP